MKKILAVFLALTMLLSMAACGQSAAESTASETPSAASGVSAEIEPAERAEDTEEPVEIGEPAETQESVSELEGPAVEEEIPQFVEVALPIVTEPVTFSIWYTWPPVLSNFTEGPGASPTAIEMEERTGVSLDYHIINTESASEEFSLMVAAGEYTDLILGGSNYYNNPDQLIEDGVAIDVAPYLDELMPNLKAVLASNEDYMLAAYTDNGCIAECYKFEIGTDQNVGPVIRKDFLEQLGMDIPITYDDYYETLKAFKTELDVEAPLLLPYTGITNYYALGYGVPADLSTGLFYVVDNQVTYAGLEQNYYDLVTLMAQWYSEGLIDQDFLTRTTTTDPDSGLIASDDAGVWTANVLMFDQYLNSIDNPDFEIVGTSYPVQSEDSPIMYLKEEKATGAGFVVTTACHDVETCLRWIDYWYSEEGTFLANYGIEGLTWEYDESGQPHLTELILASDMGLPSSLTSSIYIFNGGPFVEDCTRNQYFFGDLQKASLETWDMSDRDTCSEAYPESAGLTTEESETYSAIMGDIDTYMEEIISSILVGNASTDQLSEIANNLHAMNIDEAIKLKQDAYDRYMSKAES